MAGEGPGPGRSATEPQTQLKCMLVGLDGREHDADALALARSLQLALGGAVVLAHVIPPIFPGRGMAEGEALERRRGRELLSHAAGNLGAGVDPEFVDTELVDCGPAASGLSRLAVERQASMLVLGSSHRGVVGRIVPGGVASQLLTRAPCAIAVAPVGYAKQVSGPISRVGIAYDATIESDVALAAAADAASRLAVPLRLYHAMHQISKDPAWDKFRAHMKDYAQGILDAGLRRLPSEVQAKSSVLEGEAAEVIADASRGDGVDLLYVGSRGYGPGREALLGGVAGALLHTAPVPLVIVPRGSRRASDRSATIPDARAGT